MLWDDWIEPLVLLDLPDVLRAYLRRAVSGIVEETR